MIPRTVEELLGLWPTVAAGLGDRDEQTIAHTVSMLKPFRRSFGRRLLASLETGELARWVGRHRAHGRYVRTLLNDAVKLGALEASPFVGVRIPRARGRGEYVPSWAEAMALAEAGREAGLGDMVLLACCSGARLGALIDLQAANVDLLAVGRIRLARKGRPGTYEGVVLEPARSLSLPAVGRVFTTPELRRPWTRQSVSKRWAVARAAVGLPEACTFHATRKAFATELLNRGASMMDVAFALDHVDDSGRPRTEEVERVYGRPSREAALARLEAA
jgi:integrase